MINPKFDRNPAIAKELILNLNNYSTKTSLDYEEVFIVPFNYKFAYRL